MAAIELNEVVEIAAPSPLVWSLLADPTAVVKCVPGAAIESVEPDGSIQGTLRTKLGPTVVEFRGLITPEFDDERREGKLIARGTDKGGRTRGEAKVGFRLVALEEEKQASTLTITGTVRLEGALSAFLQTGGVHLTRRMLREFGEAISAKCVPDDDAAAAQEVVVDEEVRPISGLSLAGRVLGDIVKAFVRRIGSGLLGRFRRTGRRTEAGHEGP
jgi:carbon monoxide dehydrogenase subunit G